VAWEHEFNTDRKLTASFESLPGSGYVVYGAPAAADLARLDLGVKTSLGPAASLFVAFDSAFSGQGNTYAGRGGVTVRF
jgi:uncharacterized protein with beta-barrel porin domain